MLTSFVTCTRTPNSICCAHIRLYSYVASAPTCHSEVLHQPAVPRCVISSACTLPWQRTRSGASEYPNRQACKRRSLPYAANSDQQRRPLFSQMQIQGPVLKVQRLMLRLVSHAPCGLQTVVLCCTVDTQAQRSCIMQDSAIVFHTGCGITGRWAQSCGGFAQIWYESYAWGQAYPDHQGCAYPIQVLVCTRQALLQALHVLQTGCLSARVGSLINKCGHVVLMPLSCEPTFLTELITLHASAA